MEDRVMKKTVDSDTSSSGWSSQHEGMKGHVQHKFCSNFTALAVSLFVGGVILGFLLPSSDNLHGPYRKVSSILGWTYFLRSALTTRGRLPGDSPSISSFTICWHFPA
ncbi:unnamed protein product, partial [Choristocarpus tenellus]